MPKRTKNPRKMDLTNEGIAHYVFPKKVVEKAKELAHQDEAEKPTKERKQRQRKPSR